MKLHSFVYISVILLFEPDKVKKDIIKKSIEDAGYDVWE